MSTALPSGLRRRLRSLLWLLLLPACTHTPVAPPPPAAPPPVRPAPGHLRFDPIAPLNYQFDREIRLPDAPVSNPSGLAFGGRAPDGRVVLWTVSDGSSLVKDRFDPLRTVARLLIDPTGARPPEARPISLDPRISLCDLEAIEIDPADGALLIADERVAGEPSCGGAGAMGFARSRVFKVSPDGVLLGGPWETDVLNTDNNGIEGLAARLEADGTHLFVFEERKPDLVPAVFEYRLTGEPLRLEHVRRFHLDRARGSAQTGAAFRPEDGRLLVVDRDRFELIAADLSACAASDPVDCLRVATFRPLTVEELGLETTDGGLHRLGLVEGVAVDDEGALYFALDNNGAPYRDGDRSPRLLRFLPVEEAGSHP